MAKSFTLNTGAAIPSVWLGTWQADPGVVGDSVIAAVKVTGWFIMLQVTGGFLTLGYIPSVACCQFGYLADVVEVYNAVAGSFNAVAGGVYNAVAGGVF